MLVDYATMRREEYNTGRCEGPSTRGGDRTVHHWLALKPLSWLGKSIALVDSKVILLPLILKYLEKFLCT
jgi:hypothetical protein